MKDYLTIAEFDEKIGKSTETLRRWDREGKLVAMREPISNYRVYRREQLQLFENIQMKENKKVNLDYIIPHRPYRVLELFAGAGGLAIGLEKAGLKCVALNEIDHWARSEERRVGKECRARWAR